MQGSNHYFGLRKPPQPLEALLKHPLLPCLEALWVEWPDTLLHGYHVQQNKTPSGLLCGSVVPLSEKIPSAKTDGGFGGNTGRPTGLAAWSDAIMKQTNQN